MKPSAEFVAANMRTTSTSLGYHVASVWREDTKSVDFSTGSTESEAKERLMSHYENKDAVQQTTKTQQRDSYRCIAAGVWQCNDCATVMLTTAMDTHRCAAGCHRCTELVTVIAQLREDLNAVRHSINALKTADNG